MMNNNLPQVTVAALATSITGKILIVKTTKWKGGWGIPGGKVKHGESLKHALIREFQEEVNIDLTHIKLGLIQESIFDNSFFQKAHFVMINYYAFAKNTCILTNEEIEEWSWINPSQAKDYPLNEYTKVLIDDYINKNIQQNYLDVSSG